MNFHEHMISSFYVKLLANKERNKHQVNRIKMK